MLSLRVNLQLLIYTCTHSRVKSISTLKIFPYIFHIKPLLFSKHSPEVIPYQKFSPLKAELIGDYLHISCKFLNFSYKHL